MPETLMVWNWQNESGPAW